MLICNEKIYKKIYLKRDIKELRPDWNGDINHA